MGNQEPGRINRARSRFGATTLYNPQPGTTGVTRLNLKYSGLAEKLYSHKAIYEV